MGVGVEEEAEGGVIRRVVVNVPIREELAEARGAEEVSVMVPKPESGRVVWLANDCTELEVIV